MTTSDTDDARRTISVRGGTRNDSDVPGGVDLVGPDPAVSAEDPPQPDSEADDFGDRVAQLATQLVGSRYRWAGILPSTGFDCSGLVYYVYQQAERPIPRTQWPQLEAGPHVSRDDLQPGDIVYFANTYTVGLSHNGIYVGDGNFVHAEDEIVGVTISSLASGYWSHRYYAANRP